MAFRLAPLDNPGLDLDAVAAVTYSAVFSDVCDTIGLREQTVAPGIVPLGGGVVGARGLDWARLVRVGRCRRLAPDRCGSGPSWTK